MQVTMTSLSVLYNSRPYKGVLKPFGLFKDNASPSNYYYISPLEWSRYTSNIQSRVCPHHYRKTLIPPLPCMGVVGHESVPHHRPKTPPLPPKFWKSSLFSKWPLIFVVYGGSMQNVLHPPLWPCPSLGATELPVIRLELVNLGLLSNDHPNILVLSPCHTIISCYGCIFWCGQPTIHLGHSVYSFCWPVKKDPNPLWIFCLEMGQPYVMADERRPQASFQSR